MSVVGRSGESFLEQWPKLALAVGFVAFTIAVVAAHGSPTSGYELDIYRATPSVFWVGTGVAMAMGLVVSFVRATKRVQFAAWLLAGLCVAAIVALPILRGYYFYGAGDSLSHLGYARSFVAGTDSPLTLLYPGLHLVAVFMSGVTGAPLTWALMFTAVAFSSVFVLFVGLCARALAGNGAAFTVGLFAAALLLPINNVSVHPHLHPTSQAILFLPVLLYLVFNYVSIENRRRLSRAGTPLGVVLTIAAAGMLFFHPQQALNVLLLFAAISAGQFVVRWRIPEHPIASHRPLYWQTVVLTVLFAVWTPRSAQFRSAVTGVVEGLLTGVTPADEITQRSGSLTVVGGSIEELFVKLFLVSLLFVVFAAPFVVASFLGRLDRDIHHRNAMTKYLTLGLIPVFGLFGLFFVSSVTTQHFRYIGFLMTGATILGAASITHYASALSGRGLGHRAVRVAIVVLFVILIPLSMAALHPSPYIYQDSSEVTEAQMAGHETAFDIRDSTVPFVGVRSGPRRFVDAIYGTGTATSQEFPGRRDNVDPDVFDSATYPTAFDRPRYLEVAESDIEREVDLWGGFRYSARGFEALDATPGVNRVQSNGAYNLYFIDSEQSAT